MKSPGRGGFHQSTSPRTPHFSFLRTHAALNNFREFNEVSARVSATTTETTLATMLRVANQVMPSQAVFLEE